MKQSEKMRSSLSFSLVLFFIITILQCFHLSFSTASRTTFTKSEEGGDGADSPVATNQTDLQKHASFFDRNHDGIIYPKETFEGFRALGFGIPTSTFAASFINVGLSQKTRPGQSFSFMFPIEIKNIQLGKHTSDSGIYDTKGRFVSSKFEEVFTKYAKTNPDSFTFDELMEMVKANRVPKDYKGWLAAYVEWKFLYLMAKDKDGLLSKEFVEGVYDGSLFEHIEMIRSPNDK